jgi:two-component system, NtrC family, sensor kinase
MNSQLIMQLGIDVETFLKPNPTLVLEIEQKTYNVFFVRDTAGSPFAPAQENFVIPYKVRSVLGFGGLLSSGDLYAVLLFTRVSISRDSADIFRKRSDRSPGRAVAFC